eukprot:symbB.v1.2.023665.t1/scaffold2180.1/size86746/1
MACEDAGKSEVGASIVLTEYKIYVDLLLKPLSVEALRHHLQQHSGRRALELGLEQRQVLYFCKLEISAWIHRQYVPGCDDRKLSRACMRRAKGIEQQLQRVGEALFSAQHLGSILTPDDLHGIWHGFVAMRFWRDGRAPQECLLTFVSGICQHLGQLPPCVTPAELREVLWQQAFVENPTRAPDHRNFRRFALLSAEMVAVGVELESETVELLVRQVLNLDRPWRERRDMLSGILSAASVNDRRRVVETLDQRFEEHAEIDDFEIVCGIAEHIGVEIPPFGAIRRCALRRWALDSKRGGALPVARLSDFVDRDATIGEDVAQSLRQRGRVADAAVLLSKLPKQELACRQGLTLEVELERLQDILSFADDGAFYAGEESEFGPVDAGGFLLPDREHFVGACVTAKAADEACERLQEEVLVIQMFREEAPFWHRPGSLLVICSAQNVEIFDLLALRAEEVDGTDGPTWPLVAQKLRQVLSQPNVLKIVWGGIEELVDIAIELGLGIARCLKPNEKEPVGPVLNSQSLFSELVGHTIWQPTLAPTSSSSTSLWPSLVRRFLGLHLCLEEEGSNWSRRPLRCSQLHHAASSTWTQLPVLHAICAKT